jgi:predicted nucleic-acid-binding Zn-ribbon protein
VVLCSMAKEEFDTCPKCGVGKMKPTGGATSATSADPDTNRLTGDYYQEYKCDNCGYPEGGQAKAVQVNPQEGITGKESTTMNIPDSSNGSDIDNKDNQPF